MDTDKTYSSPVRLLQILAPRKAVNTACTRQRVRVAVYNQIQTPGHFSALRQDPSPTRCGYRLLAVSRSGREFSFPGLSFPRLVSLSGNTSPSPLQWGFCIFDSNCRLEKSPVNENENSRQFSAVPVLMGRGEPILSELR